MAQAELQDRGGNPILEDFSSQILMTIQDVRYNSTIKILSDPIEELTPFVRRGRATFFSIYFTGPAPDINLAFHSTVITSAYQDGLPVTDPPAALSWAVAPHVEATIGVLLQPQPVVEVRDQRGELVLGDSLTLVSADLRDSDGTPARLLGHWKDIRCCNGRCQFTDLALGHVGSGLRLTISSLGGELWGEGSIPASVVLGSIVSTGCYAPISCSGYGECNLDYSCACQRTRFGRMCEVGLTPTKSLEMQMSMQQGSVIDAGGGERLSVFPEPTAQSTAIIEVSMDFYSALDLPSKWLPLESDAFSPAGSVVDIRPEGVLFGAGVELALSYTRDEQESCRLWLYTFNWTSEEWQRYEDGPVTLDAQAGVIRAQLSHFSLWAVMLEGISSTQNSENKISQVLAGRGSGWRANLTALYVVAALVLVGVLSTVGWHQRQEHRRSIEKVLEAEKERALRAEEVKEELLAIAMDEVGKQKSSTRHNTPSVLQQDLSLPSVTGDDENGEDQVVELPDADENRRKSAKLDRQAQRRVANGGKEETKAERKARRAKRREEKQLALARKLVTHTVVEQGWGGWKERQEEGSPDATSSTPRQPAQLLPQPNPLSLWQPAELVTEPGSEPLDGLKASTPNVRF